jgi:hypothetical protein
MGTDTRFIRFIWCQINYGIMEIFRFFVGREKKGQAAFSAACSFARPRRSGKTGTERLPKWTSGACQLGEDWSERVVRLPQGLGDGSPKIQLIVQH